MKKVREMKISSKAHMGVEILVRLAIKNGDKPYNTWGLSDSADMLPSTSVKLTLKPENPSKPVNAKSSRSAD